MLAAIKASSCCRADRKGRMLGSFIGGAGKPFGIPVGNPGNTGRIGGL